MEIKILLQEDVKRLLDVIPEGWEGVLPIINWYTFASFCYPFKFLKDDKIVGVGVAVFTKTQLGYHTSWCIQNTENKELGALSRVT